MDIVTTTRISAGSPVAQSDRILILDSIRGFAVLGILLMNIGGFGLPVVMIWDLSVLNEFSGPNLNAWLFMEGAFEGSQRALFSMLFGAGILLFITRVEKKHAGLLPTDLYFRRQIWLLIFGAINVYIFLWPFDILFVYAFCGMLLFAFRNWPAKKLFIAAGFCLLLVTVIENRDLYRAKWAISQGEKIALLDTTTVKLTDAQIEKLATMEGLKERASLENKRKIYEAQLRNGRGNLSQVYAQNSSIGGESQTISFYNWWLWDILLFMFLGMAFFKTGILTGKHPTRTYWWLMIAGLAIGLIISSYRVSEFLHYRFNGYLKAKGAIIECYELQRFFRSVGILGLIMLLYKSGWFKWLFSLMRPVGQMAFSNYLMQSVICGIIFWGVGFGMFGRFQRHELYYVVAGVWVFQILFSHIWLRHFRFGPFEWLWRSLTYWELQPMKKIAMSSQVGH